MRTKLRSKISFLFVLFAAMLAIPAVALASAVDTAVVDVNVPETSITLAPGGSDNININMRVTGEQKGIATFKVNRDWTLSGGTFTGSNPQLFTVNVRDAKDAANLFTTTGTVNVASDQADGGPFNLKATAFDFTNSNTQGAKLSAGTAGTYAVTVETPQPATDTTAPTIDLTTPADNATYIKNEVVNAAYTCTDEDGGTGVAPSGVASCEGDVANGDPIDTSTVGEHTFTVNAADEAGNTAEAVHHYYVHYDFKGFFQPVDNLPTYNTVKAGSSVPAKFSLSGDQGLGIIASGYPASITVPCVAAAPTDAIEQTATAGGSSLSYDSVADQYNYVWKTEKAWAGTCRQFVLKLDDGTFHQANFKLTK
jgi:hypothetical protein